MKYKVALMAPLGLVPFGAQPAAAADMPVKAPHVTSFDPSWSGFYAGVNLGVISDHSRQTEFPGGGYCFFDNTNCASTNSQTATGVLGGAQIGYNFQTGALVYGVEVDFDLSSARKTTTGASVLGLGNWTAQNGVKEFGTARLRLGYAFDRALVYATGGLAYANMNNAFLASGNAGYSWSATTGWRAGLTVGGGVEYMVDPKWSIRGEALFYDLGRMDHFPTEGAGRPLAPLTDHMTGAIARIGLNYLFH
jgi:outer membrane immunogenic protein